MTYSGKLATVKIFKFDPAIEENPNYVTFRVPYEGSSVLNILKTIYHDHDSDLAFRWGCEGAGDCRCGACAVMVNNKPALSCRKTAEADMVIEPHPKFKVIRDLVVDFNRTRTEVPIKSPSVEISIDSEKCVKCADCVAICLVGIYKTKKGELILESPEFCLGETCKQCVTYCQANAITVKSI